MVPAPNSMSPRFDRYIGIDYSAAQMPSSSLKGHPYTGRHRLAASRFRSRILSRMHYRRTEVRFLTISNGIGRPRGITRA